MGLQQRSLMIARMFRALLGHLRRKKTVFPFHEFTYIISPWKESNCFRLIDVHAPLDDKLERNADININSKKRL